MTVCDNHGRPREILIARDELAKLLDYSLSLPTGTTVGKRWRNDVKATRRKSGPDDESEWQIGEYVECPCVPDGRIGIAWAWALDPETREPHRGLLDPGSCEHKEGNAMTSETVAQAVAKEFGVTRDALGWRSRRAQVLLPRQVAMYLSASLTGEGIAEIGRTFNRAHSSVRNAIGKIGHEVTVDERFRTRVAGITRTLAQGFSPRSSST